VRNRKKNDDFFLGGGGYMGWILDGEIRPLFEEGSAGKLSSLNEGTLFFS